MDSIIVASLIGALSVPFWIVIYYVQASYSKKNEVAMGLHKKKLKLFADMAREIPYVFVQQYKERLTPEERLKHAEQFYGPYLELWLYASDDSIRRINDVIGLYGPSPPKDHNTATIAELLLQMRKDSGIKTKLTIDDVRFFQVTG
jgi:uncharacterized protein YihD (DUF1040 family)